MLEVGQESMKKYPLMDPKVDFAFKQIFAGNTKESKIVLINLLNAILDLKGDDEIKGEIN